jgi:hypothetical protein
MNNTVTQKRFILFTWIILVISILLPVMVWGTGINWRIATISPYQWFPLFGLLAWMIMWTHYVVGAIRTKWPDLNKPKHYSVVTSYIVLAALLLHPGILAYAQFQNDAGLPPVSFVDYVGEGLLLAIILGSVALTIFLSFEVFNRLKNRSFIKKWWLAISFTQSIAMLLIFVHALKLGTHLTSGWFLLVWLIYGAILLPCFYIIHTAEHANRTKTLA